MPTALSLNSSNNPPSRPPLTIWCSLWRASSIPSPLPRTQTGLTALHLAAKEGFVDIVEELISRGAHIDAPTRKGNTPLHISSLAGHLEVVRLLLDAGANVNAQSLVSLTCRDGR